MSRSPLLGDALRDGSWVCADWVSPLLRRAHWHVSASAKRYFRHRAFKMRAFTCLPWETGQNASVVDPSLFPWRFQWKRCRWFCSVS